MTSPAPDDIQEPERPSLYRAAVLLEQAASNISYDRANCLSLQAIAVAMACQAVSAEQQVKVLASIRDRLDTLIRQGARGLHTRPKPPPAPPVPPTFSQR